MAWRPVERELRSKDDGGEVNERVLKEDIGRVKISALELPTPIFQWILALLASILGCPESAEDNAGREPHGARRFRSDFRTTGDGSSAATVR
jgi:hypothetical protein